MHRKRYVSIGGVVYLINCFVGIFPVFELRAFKRSERLNLSTLSGGDDPRVFCAI